MPDAVEALLTLAAAPRERLTRTAYNVGAFSPSAAEFREIVLKYFPGAAITTRVDEKRQGIVDSWPADVDTTAAQTDWAFRPQFNLERAFQDYLIPSVKDRYGR
jgi:threonine 3-dehydrogenase